MTPRQRYLVTRPVLVVVGVAWLATVQAIVAAPTARAALVAVAVADNATIAQGELLTVPAPGVLENDLQLVGASTAVLMTDVTHGALTLDPDGGYRYRSDAGFSGADHFRYRIEGGLLGPSNTTTVTITVSKKATPTPTPTPTPAPTAAPTPTPRPTAVPTPSPVPTPRPTALPTLDPLPSRLPIPTSLVPTPTPIATPTASAGPSATPTPTPTPVAGSTGGGGSAIGGSTSGPSRAPVPTSQPGSVREPFTIPAPDLSSGVELDPGSITFSSFDWAVPALVLSVPGLLLVLAVAVEALIGLAWIPLARRWIGDEDPHRRRRRRASAV